MTPYSVKFFLDCLHLIPARPVDLATILEVVDFCQFEGKTTYESFEVDLVEGLIDSVLQSSLPLGTELLVSAFLAKVDSLTDDRYQQKVAEKLTPEAVSLLLYKFDMKNELNRRLIELCVTKGIFADDSHQSVVYTLMMYGKELQEFQAENLGPAEAAIEGLEIEDDFRPDARSVR